MKVSAILLILVAVTSSILLTVKASRERVRPDNSNSSNNTLNVTTNPGPKQIRAVVRHVVGAWQTTWIVLRRHVPQTPFEHCGLPDSIVNPPNTNLTIEERLLRIYNGLGVVYVPLREVVNYEVKINNVSDVYQNLSWIQRELITSLREIRNMRSVGPLIMEQLLHQYHNSTSNDTALQDPCKNEVKNSMDKFRNLFKVFGGLTLIGNDLINIDHELDPHYPLDGRQ